jgi:hypothetical protein
MKLVDRGLVYDASAQPESRKIAFFTSLCPLTSGTWLCAFQCGSAKHAPQATIGICRSTNGARTWTFDGQEFPTNIGGVPGSLAGAELIEVQPGRLLLFTTWFDRRDPTRPLFNPVTEGILASKQLVAESTDEGQTWNDWREISTGNLTGCAMTGPVVGWSDGTLLFAFESFKEFDDPRPANHASWVLPSRDFGRTYADPIPSGLDSEHRVYYWDQRLCPLPATGEFLAFYWTHDRERKCDLTVHWSRQSIQRPGEFSMQPTPIEGQIAAPVVDNVGRINLLVVDRRSPCTIALWRSPDDGRTWPERLVVYEHIERARLSQGHENIDYAQFWEDMGKWSFGHPALRRLDDRHLLCAFYAGTPDRMSIHWAVVAE